MDQTAPADQGFLRHQRERGEDSNLDCRVRVCAGGDRAQALGSGSQSVSDPTDSQPHALRENPHFIRPSGHRRGCQFHRKRQPTDSVRLLTGQQCRHVVHNTGETLRLYELAAGNAPSRGPDRALIYREWGMVLRDSGDPDATDRAITSFDIALIETPNDVVAAHALAVMLARKGSFARIVKLLEPLVDHPNPRTRDFVRPLLLLAYDRTGDLLKAALLRSQGVKPWEL